MLPAFLEAQAVQGWGVVTSLNGGLDFKARQGVPAWLLLQLALQNRSSRSNPQENPLSTPARLPPPSLGQSTLGGSHKGTCRRNRGA